MIILNVITLIGCGILENIVLKSIKNGKIARTPTPEDVTLAIWKEMVNKWNTKKWMMIIK
jgi:hypothetical protein